MAIDGFNNAMISEVMLYEETHQTNNQFEKWAEVAKKTYKIIDTAQNLRDDLTTIFIGHVENADPYVTNDVDKFFTPGKQLKNTIKVDGKFNYVFYAKSKDGEFFFETMPNNSTARSPHQCFPEIISNDLAKIISTIENYEEGE